MGYIDYKEELEKFSKETKMNYKEYQEKLEKIEEARDKMRRGQMTREEFWKNYEGIPTKPLPDNFTAKVLALCDYSRGVYGLRGDGVLKVIDYTVFADNPDIVYVVFDTEFRRERDFDYRVVAFPVEIFSDDKAQREYEFNMHRRFEAAMAAKEKAEKKKQQRDQFRLKYEKAIIAESNLRMDIKNWERLKKTYLKAEVPGIIDSLIKRGILESEHKDDYIAFIKCDLI